VDLDDHRGLRLAQHLAGLVRRQLTLVDLEVDRLLQRGLVQPRELALVVVDDDGRDVTRIGVDRVAEDDHVADGDRQQRHEGHAVAHHVDQLLGGDGGDAVECLEHLGLLRTA